MKGFPPRTILVAADLSAPSLAALDAGTALARRWGAALEIVRIRAEAPAAAALGPGGMPFPWPEPDPEQERALERRLSALGTGLREPIRVRTVHGWPVREMLEKSSAGADLLVLGTHGYAGLDRILLGSVAEAVVRTARVPVLTVRASRAPLKIARVLAPWNGTPHATRALRCAREAARGLGAELRVLRVVPPGYSIRRSLLGPWRRIKALLGDGKDPSWSLRVRVGDAREHILREANSGRYGLLVLSAHRRPFSSDVVLGSTVERALRHSLIPVLSVPSGRPSRL